MGRDPRHLAEFLPMNPTPAEQWCRDQTRRFNNRIPTAPIEDCWLPDPAFLPQSVNNPVARPAGARAPYWFDVRDTAEGSAVANTLGANSGYFQEYAGWAPPVSWLFDTTAAFLEIAAHPELPPSVRDFILPYLYSYVEVTEALHDQLSLQRIHARHKGSGLEGSWRAIQAEIRLADRGLRFGTARVDGTLERMRKELLTQELKHATKAAASRKHASSTTTGATSSNTSRSNKGARGPAAPSKPAT